MRWLGLACVGSVVAAAGALVLLGAGGASEMTRTAAAERSAGPPAVDPVPGGPEEPTSVASEALGAAPPSTAARPEPTLAELRAPASAPREPRAERPRGRRDRYWVGATFTPADWAPPEGPVRIALQAGHWKANEAPPELAGLRDNGTQANGKAEWEVNLAIAREAAAMLEELGYAVDILPAVVPPSYRAHLFISIHADGSRDPKASGYRVAAPRNDVTGRAERVAEVLEAAYGEATGLTRLPTVTRRMSNYYAFNFRRYQHALHPLTIGVILETGFLTSASDRRVIVDDPARAARGIVAAVTALPETPPPRPLPAPLASAAGASE